MGLILFGCLLLDVPHPVTAPDMGFAFLNIHILHEVVSKVAMVGFSRPERPESVYGET